MKKFLFFLFATAILCSTILGSVTTYAQTFSIERDTVRYTYINGSGEVFVRDSIIPVTGSSIITWSIIATNFPADWQTNTQMCDNHNCFAWSQLWPTSGSTTKTSNAYASGTGSVRDFHLVLNLTGATTPGTYYVVVKMNTSGTDTNQVYSITYGGPSAIPTVSKVSDEMSLYPNPTNNDINVVYSATANIKTISVYNIIGKAMAIYKPVTDNSANLSLENVPAGIYFVRLINAQGEVVATRKFTKQ